MHRILSTTRNLAVLAATAFIAVTTPTTSAQHGGGGGGGGPTGTIYFIDSAGATNHMGSMNPDGTNKTKVGWYGYFKYPSRALHNNHRWYLTVRQISGVYYPDGTTQRSEVFAIRDDYDPTLNSNSDTRVQLTEDPTLQPVFSWFKGMQWLPGDQKISFKARRWSGSVVFEGGLYTADLLYRTDGNIIGLVTPPTFPALAFPLDASGWPVFGTHSWDPSGTRVVYNDNPITGLWVATLSSNTRTQILAGGANYPEWSPDGTKILFSAGGNINTIKPTGTGMKVVIKPTYLNTAYWSSFGHPYFSPTGNYVVCVGWTSYNGGTDDVFRATASGGSLTNLTKTTTVNEVPVGWR